MNLMPGDQHLSIPQHRHESHHQVFIQHNKDRAVAAQPRMTHLNFVCTYLHKDDPKRNITVTELAIQRKLYASPSTPILLPKTK